MILTSVKNDTVRLLRSLKTGKGRKGSGLHLIEGERLVMDAIDSGVVPETVLVAEWNTTAAAKLNERGLGFTGVSGEVMKAVCDTENPQGVCAAVRTPDLTPPESYPSGLVIALDRLQDPGNLGTVLRTADAFGAAGLLLGEGCTDPFSCKAVRAAMGSTYHIPIWKGDLPYELGRLSAQGFALVCGHLAGEEELPPLPENRVLVIGNEANGVSPEAAEKCILYRLPMRGRAESLNAAVAAAILVYKLTEG
ncbi:MAG: RNA methyltransferase [Clostridia bacterium]|nr:RNA methyltransferase [Clostridia bacterium]